MTWIYFCLVDNERIKIGKADNLATRMRQHAKTQVSTHDVVFLAAVEGCPADERHVQRYFANDAIDAFKPAGNGVAEVFKPTPRLTNYIRWLRNQWFAVVSDKDTLDSNVSFEMWEPNPERQVPPICHPLFPPDYLEFTDRVVTGDDYYTNPEILSLARKVLGSIDLDPASHPLANKHVKADRFFGIQDNGLEQQWNGRVWLNPPFSQWKDWVPKILSELRSCRVQAICIYCAMRTITAQYFRPLLDSAFAMCVITGRKKHGGKGGDSPDDGHCVFYVGPDVNKFCVTFESTGVVFVKPQR